MLKPAIRVSISDSSSIALDSDRNGQYLNIYIYIIYLLKKHNFSNNHGTKKILTQQHQQPSLNPEAVNEQLERTSTLKEKLLQTMQEIILAEETQEKLL